jgi:ABC-type multidrug transport system fused ATPase/permease subunit
MYLKRGSEPPQTYSVESDSEGAFTFIPNEQPSEGVYQLWAEVTDARGAQSAPSRTVTIAVKPPVLFEIGNVAVTALSVFVPLIALLIVLGMLIGFIWHRVRRFRRRVRREAGEASEALHDAFDHLRKRVRRTIKTFEDTERSRELTKEERATLSQLRSTLDEAERTVAEEIEDIEDVRW